MSAPPTTYRGFAPTGPDPSPLDDRIRDMIDAWHNGGFDEPTALCARGWFPDPGLRPAHRTPAAAVEAHAAEVDPGIEAYDDPAPAPGPAPVDVSCSWPRLTERWLGDAGMADLRQRQRDELATDTSSSRKRANRIEAEIQRRNRADADMRATRLAADTPTSSGVASDPEPADGPPVGSGEGVLGSDESTNADGPSGISPPPPPLSSEGQSVTYTDVDTAGMPPVDVPLAMIEAGADDADRLRLEVERLSDVIAAEPLASVRASSMPIAMRCPASVRPMYARWQDESEAARLGSAVHDALSYFDERAPLDEIAARWSVPGADLRYLFFQGLKARRRLVEAFGQPALVEQALEYVRQDGTKLTGHVDLAFVVRRSLIVVDYKSGRVHGDYEDQLRTYGAAAASWFEDDVEVENVAAYVVWLRDANDDGEPTIVREGVWSVEELYGWAEADADRVFHWDGNYHAGEHCEYCPLRHSCPAHDDRQRAAVRWALDLPGAPSARHLDDADLVELRHRAKRLGRIAEDADKATREVVQLRGEVGPFRAIEGSRKAYLVDAVLDALGGEMLDAYDASGPTVTSGVVSKLIAAANADPAEAWRLIKAAGGEVRTTYTQIRETKPRRGEEEER